LNRYIHSVFLFLFLFASCSDRETSPLPQSILNLELSEKIQGAAAAEIINHLHLKEVAAVENFIGRYRDNGHSATYYLSLYSNSTEAEAELTAMVASMKMGGHVFDHVRRRTVNEKDIYMALGMGQAHYFYSDDNKLIWMAIDIPIAEDAIKALVP
jgi:hypothetical protein